MLTEARIVHLVVYVHDLAVSKAFYEDALGLRVIEADPGAKELPGRRTSGR